MKRNRKKTDAAQQAPNPEAIANEESVDESVAAPEEANPAEDQETLADDPLTKLSAERDQLQRQLHRTLADLQNFRKRRVQEMADARRSAIEALASELLPVLDNFHLATDYESGEEGGAAQSVREGLLMVRGLLEGVFERHGVLEINAAGEKFDPAVHEAVGIDPDPDATEGLVTKVVQRGYTIDGRVLRPTRVMVGGAPQTANDETEG